MVSLAFAVYSNKGAYALLLGSGISHAAGIPTGWEIVLDLVRKVAKLMGEDCGADPVEWHKKKIGTEPDYSQLLDDIAKTPAERQQLLRGYFEPTADEQAQGVKLPSEAHKSIARLVASGYIRVIITTNFDRLIERALEEAGVSPAVISTPDQIAGALPLIHAGPTVIKLHGDYQDTRIKNTGVELAAYDGAVSGLLDRILDEYGLIVSGWSGDWDLALRAAIERCPNHRFTTFWTARSPLGEKATQLAKQRLAIILQIKDANTLFVALWEKIQALQDMNAPHPLSAKMAVSTLKRYLADPLSQIRLRDYVHAETEKLFAEINSSVFSGETKLQPPDEIKLRAGKYNVLSELLLSMFVTGCYWGRNDDAIKLWINCLQRIANPTPIGGFVYLTSFRLYPALLLYYSGGIGAIASGEDKTLAAILSKPKVRHENTDKAACSVLYPIHIMENAGEYLMGKKCRGLAGSRYLFEYLRNSLREFLPRDDDYETAFNRFEYLLGLVHADMNRLEWNGDAWWGPIGLFAASDRHYPRDGGIAGIVDKELDKEGAGWPLLKAGLFGGNLEQVKTAKAKYDAFWKRVPLF